MLKRIFFVLMLLVVATSFAFTETIDDADPFMVTADNVDPRYATPVIDLEDDVETPIKGHLVTGHFAESSSQFSFFFPSKEYLEGDEYHWEGRFYMSVYPGTGGTLRDSSIIQNARLGAYSVTDMTPQEGGYRSVAATAKFSRECAAKYYGYEDHIYGYVYGGSGGGSVSLGCIEGTEGVFDGAAPYVVPVLTGIPYNQASRIFAKVVLRDVAPQIAEALEIGGSGNPYEYLTSEQAYFYTMLSNYGVPSELWRNYMRFLELDGFEFTETEGTAAAGIPASGLMEMARYAIKKDTTYWDEFWENPLYLGAADTPEAKYFQSFAYEEDFVIQKVVTDKNGKPAQLRLSGLPVDTTGVGLRYQVFTADGTLVGELAGTVNTKKKALDVDLTYSNDVFPAKGTAPEVLAQLADGMILRASNKRNLAMVSVFMYHLPTDAEDHHSYGNLESNMFYLEQFLNEDGSLPASWRDSQRKWMAVTTQGEAYPDGDYGTEKVILVGCLADNEAYILGPEVYTRQVRDVLGDKMDDQYRIWWFDNADHMDSAVSSNPQYYIAYSGGLMEALRELSDWTEKGIEPSKNTQYTVVDSQVILADANAVERGGIQPTIDVLTANAASEKLVIQAGTEVCYEASFTLAEKANNLTAVRWDADGDGVYEDVEITGLSSSYRHTFNEPGIYMSAVKIDGQNDVFVGTSSGVAQNFRKVRIVVEPSVSVKASGDDSVVTFLGNDRSDDSRGQIYGAKRYFPVSWKAGEGKGEFAAEGGVWSATVPGSGDVLIECEVQFWNGYYWETSANETMSAKLVGKAVEAPKASAAPAAAPTAPAPAPVPAEKSSSGAALWIVLAVVVVAAAICVCILLKKKRK